MLDSEQRKYLQERIRRAEHRLVSAATSRGRKEPPHVRHARRVLVQWEKRCDREDDRATKRVHARTAEAREAVLFASPEKALALVKRLERGA